MKILDASLPTAEANLALDEALLDALDQGEGAETLRFWESARPFVVVGHGNRVAAEVQAQVCARRQIPILRRCSGGGTVLQGPGCLNYALTLRIPAAGPLSQIGTTNRFVMDRLRAAVAPLTPSPVAVQGITDLAVAATVPASEDDPPTTLWFKFSGNAQRRKRQALLFHGSFLLDLDLALLESVLAHPSQEPAYRVRRAHGTFVTNVAISPAALKNALAAAWGATETLAEPPWDRLGRLVDEKYSRAEWNFRF